MHVYGLLPCGDNTAALTLSFASAPTADAGHDVTICSSSTYDFSGVSAANYSSLLWEFSPSNAGTLSDATLLKPVFSPAAGFTGDVTLSLKAYGSPVCSAVTASDAMVLTIVTGIALDAGANQIILSGEATTLHGTASGGSGIYAWTWEPSSLLLDNMLPEPSTLPINQQTRFTTKVVDVISLCSAQDEVVVSIKVDAVSDFDSTLVNTAVTIPVLNNDANPGTETRSVSACGDPAHGIIVINQDNTITYTPDSKFIGNDKFCYMVCNSGNPLLCDTATVFVHVIAKLDDLVIYNLITPNGDNSNDTWSIKGIEDFPDNTIVIFNRWGDKVRDFSKYDNINVFWDGTNNKGEILPSATYYYILTIKDVGSRTGWIYLQDNDN
jgi:gliding motility-associated-like protein